MVISIPTVHRGQLGAVQRDQFPAKQLQLVAEQMELPMHGLEAGTMFATKIGDGFEIRRQLAKEPDEFQVALALPLQRP